MPKLNVQQNNANVIKALRNALAMGAIKGPIASDGSDNFSAGAVVPISFSSFSSLPQTVNNSKITATQVLVHSVLSNPAAQTGDWTVTTAAGSVTISGTINGSTTVTLYLAEPI